MESHLHAAKMPTQGDESANTVLCCTCWFDRIVSLLRAEKANLCQGKSLQSLQIFHKPQVTRQNGDEHQYSVILFFLQLEMYFS